MKNRIFLIATVLLTLAWWGCSKKFSELEELDNPSALSGFVRDNNNQALDSVAVILILNDTLPFDTIYTDRNGYFVRDSIPSGHYRLVFIRPGFKSGQLDTLSVLAGVPLQLGQPIVLTPSNHSSIPRDLLHPTNGDTVSSFPITLTWKTLGIPIDSVTFTVRGGIKPDWGNLATAIKDTSLTISPNASGVSQFCWQVSANFRNQSIHSDTTCFTLIPPDTSITTFVHLDGMSTINSNTSMLSWSTNLPDVGDSIHIDILNLNSICAANSCRKVLTISPPANPLPISGLAENSSYRIFITLYHQGEEYFSDTSKFFIPNVAPAPVKIQNLIALDYKSIRLTYNASTVNDFSQYLVQWSTTAFTSGSTVFDTSFSRKSDTSLTLRNLASNTDYYFRVLVIDSLGLSSASGIEKVHTANSPSGIYIISPSLSGRPYYTNKPTLIIKGGIDTAQGLSSVKIQKRGNAEDSIKVQSDNTWSDTLSLGIGSNMFYLWTVNKSKADSFVVIRDVSSPSILWLTPANDTIIGQSSLKISGSVSDNEQISLVKILQGPQLDTLFLAQDNSFTLQWDAIPGGTSKLVVKAEDAAGNFILDTLIVTRDTILPSIAIQKPSIDTSLISNTAMISGSTSDNIGLGRAGYYVPGFIDDSTSLILDSKGLFSFNIVGLPEGKWSVIVYVYDAVGNSNSAKRTLTRDITPPQVIFTSPSKDTLVNDTLFNIRGRVVDSSKIDSAWYWWKLPRVTRLPLNSLLAMGKPLVTTPTLLTVDPIKHTWEILSQSLLVGTDTLMVRAKDVLGNTKTFQLLITLDIDPPNISISSPQNGRVVGKDTITVKYTADGITRSKLFTLKADTNFLIVDSTDAAGNTGSDTVMVVYDKTPPHISITGPTSEASIVVNDSYNWLLDGSVWDNNSVDSVTLRYPNGDVIMGNLNENYFYFNDMGVDSGLTQLIVEAYDSVGNIGRDTLNVTSLRNVWFINKAAKGQENGTSWKDAFTNIHEALSTIPTGNFWMASGTYLPDSGTNNPAKYPTLGVKSSLYGGFSGNESALNQRDFVNNVTLISGDLDGDATRGKNSSGLLIVADSTVIDGIHFEWAELGSALSSTGHAVTIRNSWFNQNYSQNGAIYLGRNSKLNFANLVIENGGIPSASYGAAIHAQSSTIAGKNLTITNNAAVYGGGLYLTGSQVTIDGLNLTKCRAMIGGAIVSGSTRLELSGATIKDNFTFVPSSFKPGNELAGGIYQSAGQLIMTQSNLEKNTATNRGGAIYSIGGNISITGTQVSSNTSQYGGGIYIDSAQKVEATLTGVDFIKNIADSSGGALFVNRYISTAFEKVSFDGNQATYGGALWDYLNIGTAKDMTFLNNSATYGGAWFTAYSSSTISIGSTWPEFFKSNTAKYGGDIYDLCGAHIWQPASPTGIVYLKTCPTRG